MKRLAYDIGGTTMRVAQVNENGIGSVARVRTASDPEEGLDTLMELARVPEVDSAVVAIAGNVDLDGNVIDATNLPEWNGFKLASALKRRLMVPVLVYNDAELAALGEAIYGAGKDMAVVAYIGLGTGVGTACIKEGAIEPGVSGGEVRERIITLASGGTLEELLGGRSLTEHYGIPPEQLPPKVWKELTPLLAEGIHNAILQFAPDVVVLGGSLVNEEAGFHVVEVAAHVRRLMKKADTVPDIRKALLGDASALHGARAVS